MRAHVEEDLIIHLNPRGAVEIGPLPRGVGLERLRWDGERVVDLADLDKIWVERKNGVFVLHAVETPGSQPVAMTYADRRRLTADPDGTIRILKAEELSKRETRDVGMRRIGGMAQQVDDLRRLLVAVCRGFAPSNHSHALTQDEIAAAEELLQRIETDE